VPDIKHLDFNSPEIIYLCNKDKRLAKVIETVGPISYITHDNNPYAFLIHEVIEQMLSVKAGQAIFNRLSSLCNDDICCESINSLSIDQLRSIGISKAKAEYIMGITNAVLSGSLDFSVLDGLPDDTVIERLTSFRGIGNWTAKMYLIFVLDRPDILPYEDGAFLQSYKWLYNTTDISSNEINKHCKKWSPYSSTAARYLYRALDYGMTKQAFYSYK